MNITALAPNMHNRISIRRVVGTAASLAALFFAAAAGAAEPEWLKVVTPRFGLVSQLNEDATRKWAVEFDQFVEAQHQLFSVDDLALPPLTIVLFRDARRFAPYRNQTESGQANVAGFFANRGTWSTIGLSSRSPADMRNVVYHEATHWVMSATEIERPMWFEEGIAGAFSTFEVKNGKGYWGAPLPDYVAYLNAFGVQPMDEFFRTSQDEALHGSSVYYAQAWAFVHYLMYGDGGAQRARLVRFLQELRETDLDTAFTNAFEQSYEEFLVTLRRYLRSGKYAVGSLDVQDRSGEMTHPSRIGRAPRSRNCERVSTSSSASTPRPRPPRTATARKPAESSPS